MDVSSQQPTAVTCRQKADHTLLIHSTVDTEASAPGFTYGTGGKLAQLLNTRLSEDAVPHSQACWSLHRTATLRISRSRTTRTRNYTIMHHALITRRKKHSGWVSKEISTVCHSSGAPPPADRPQPSCGRTHAPQPSIRQSANWSHICHRTHGAAASRASAKAPECHPQLVTQLRQPSRRTHTRQKKTPPASVPGIAGESAMRWTASAQQTARMRARLTCASPRRPLTSRPS